MPSSEHYYYNVALKLSHWYHSTTSKPWAPKFWISATLTAAIGQQLARMNCTYCKTAYKPSTLQLKMFKLPASKNTGKGVNTVKYHIEDEL